MSSQGRVDVIFEGTAVAVPQINSGRMRALAVMGSKRSSGLPNVPSVAEELPGSTRRAGSASWCRQARHSRSSIGSTRNSMRRSIHRTCGRKSRAMLLEPSGDSPQEFGAFIRSQSERWGKVIPRREHQGGVEARRGGTAWKRVIAVGFEIVDRGTH
jgi:tripartite-type tricarboxylate transporter receptor subunit TctC